MPIGWGQMAGREMLMEETTPQIQQGLSFPPWETLVWVSTSLIHYGPKFPKGPLILDTSVFRCPS